MAPINRLARVRVRARSHFFLHMHTYSYVHARRDQNRSISGITGDISVRHIQSILSFWAVFRGVFASLVVGGDVRYRVTDDFAGEIDLRR